MESDADAKALVAAVRAAAQRHEGTWGALVPDPFRVDLAHEAAEEAAYLAMMRAKTALREHIRDTYGLSPGELNSLAAP